MNVKNNKRKRESMEKIEKIFIDLLQKKEISEITVTDICAKANLNRSTFYANYADVYDLADKIKEKLETDFGKSFANQVSGSALMMFSHIYENKELYLIYFKLGYDEKHKAYIYDRERAEKEFEGKYIDYHIEFFRSGINAIIKMWLRGGCKETPEEMAEIIESEYMGRKSLYSKECVATAGIFLDDGQQQNI